MTVEGVLTAFRTVDAKDNGKLDLVGFTLCLEELGLTWSKAETQEHFERADVNHDGFITLEELQALLDTL
ncbi:EF-hand domain-containing protein [Actinocorallia longicatena]|uniref:EF-hand domain-containing protein n=1 Tax=Actinocorallia longicatena TaxID=111803 RepID=A0ABP6QR86_9ACTN